MNCFPIEQGKVIPLANLDGCSSQVNQKSRLKDQEENMFVGDVIESWRSVEGQFGWICM
jgi:hypothetical protein